MLAISLLKDAFDRVAQEFPATLEGLAPEQLLWRPGADANSIGWLAWHIARCEDAQMAPLRGYLDEGMAGDAASMVSAAAMLDPLGAAGVTSMTGLTGSVLAAQAAEQGSPEASERSQNSQGQDTEAPEVEDIWATGGWYERFALPYPRDAIGYGQTSEEVAAFDVTDTDLLTGYYAEVHGATLGILDRLQESDFERIVDTNWDPPVTLGVRVVSVLNDITAHQGQIAYLRGLVLSRA